MSIKEDLTGESTENLQHGLAMCTARDEKSLKRLIPTIKKILAERSAPLPTNCRYVPDEQHPPGRRLEYDVEPETTAKEL